MQKFQWFHLLLLKLIFLCPNCVAQQNPTNFCGKIQIQSPFLLQNSSKSSLLNRMILCKSRKLYFRTSIGLYPISSINYTTKLLTISHKSSSSSSHFISPSKLSAGFPPPPQPNSLILFNCSNQTYPNSPFLHNCTSLQLGADAAAFSSCLMVDDTEKLGTDFHPKDLNCSRYSRVYKPGSHDNIDQKVEVGTRICFDIPDHVPNVCDECQKPRGNCGVGLKCVCHPKECRDKVISMGARMNPVGNIIVFVIYFIAVMDFILQVLYVCVT